MGGEARGSESAGSGPAGAGSFAVGNKVSESSSEDEARIWESPSWSGGNRLVSLVGIVAEQRLVLT